ncbi:phosphotransferase [Phytoactinopolyspora mesophila]|nr:phosphotransferase [Phytoactinopolyspora mesophila]
MNDGPTTGETPLPGGHVSTVVRVGEKVLRTPGRRAAFVRKVLKHFDQCGWNAAPIHLGFDADGREVLTFIDGHVPWTAHHISGVTSDLSLCRVAELVREFHDLTAGTRLAGKEEVVCHNDLSPKNTVYHDAGAGPVPVAFIDWDLAAPGRRIHDVAHVCWQYAGLGPAADPEEAARQVQLISDAYGLAEPENLVDTILWWQDRCWRGIEAAADDEPAMARLRDAGVPAEIRAAHKWVRRHRQVLEAALL